MKIYKWTFGLSVKENIKANILMESYGYSNIGSRLAQNLNGKQEFDFADYIKNKHNNKFPLGLGQKAGCSINEFFSKI